jgi:HlyD family secretion protein
MKRHSLWLALVGFVLVVVGGGGFVMWKAEHAKAVRYVTVRASVGPISREITASGSVNPVVNVQVGAFVSGNIQALYCDYNTAVRKGQLCAKIDSKPYETAVARACADLDTQRAQLGKDQATLVYAEQKLGRSRTLTVQGWNSQDTLDAARSTRDQAKAQVTLDRAQIRQSQAALQAAEINLNYTNIVSPVEGTVVSRNINVGQTVAASFQTPTLFLIAKDLTKMQVDTNVSESDIGGAAPGAAAEFTVEAWPGRVFRGRVTQVRQAPVSVQNVITYDVVIAADNPDLLLKPGMTATAKVIVARRDNVLRVPVQALRYSPPAAARPTGGAGRAGHAPANNAPQRVWVLRDGKPVRARVSVGLDDDAFAEITGGELRAGEAVIVSEARPNQNGGSRQASRQTPVRFGP